MRISPIRLSIPVIKIFIGLNEIPQIGTRERSSGNRKPNLRQMVVILALLAMLTVNGWPMHFRSMGQTTAAFPTALKSTSYRRDMCFPSGE